MTSCQTLVSGILIALLFVRQSHAEPSAPGSEQAQDPPVIGADGSRWGFAPLLLLNDANVQDELNLSEDQKQRLDELGTEFMTSFRAEFDRITGAVEANASDSQKRRGIMQRRIMGLKRDAAERALNILTVAQRKRLDQMAFQLRGVDALYRHDVASELKLKEEQRSQVNAARRDLVKQARELARRRKNGEIDAKAYRSQTHALLVNAKAKVVSLLNKSQRKILDRLQGPPLPFNRWDLVLRMGRQRKASQRQ